MNVSLSLDGEILSQLSARKHLRHKRIRDTEEREGVVGWWLLATPLVTFVPILARFEIRPIVWDFDRRERRRDGEKEKLSVREDGQARYRRGKTWGRGEEVDRGHPAAPVCARRTVFRALMRAD